MIENQFKDYLVGLYPQNTIDSYVYSVNKFKAEHPNGDNYTYQNIVDYFYTLKRQKLSTAYRGKILASLKKYYEFLVHINLRDEHPCRRFQLNCDRLKGVHFDDLFTPDELQQLMDREVRYAILEIKIKVVISLLIFQGLTGEEIVRLSLPDIDLDSGLIRIRATKKLNGRQLELHRTQIMLFSNYLNEVRPVLEKKSSASFILNKLGNSESVDNIHALVHSMKLLFPTKTLSPQKIRLSVISNWLNVQKIPLSDVQLMAGHKWPSTTEKYLRTDLDAKRELINRYHPLEKMQMI